MKKNKHILIVDDNADLREIYSDMLSGLFEVKAVSNTSDALKEMRSKKPDLLILDVVLKGEKGTDFFNSIKKSGEFPGIKILFITVISDLGKRIMKKDPESRFLAKPFDRAGLLKAINEMI